VSDQEATSDPPIDLAARAQKMEALSVLAAGMAHELNNPLASIVAFSQLIRSDPSLPENLRRSADLLVDEANRVRTIVGNVLDFARQRPPERVDSELRPIIDGVVDLQAHLIRSHVTVEVDVPADLPLVSIDRAQLQHALLNVTLIGVAAIRGQGRPGTIRIVASTVDGDGGNRVRIVIADDGPGLPETTGEGSALGLAVASTILVAHGGSLRHEATPGGGTTFVIELPAASAAGVAPAASGAPAAPATSRHTSTTGRRARILVLDDEPSIRDFLGRVLARHGYDPVLAASGSVALDIVRSDPPDAILCDHRMASMSGMDFHAAVRAIDPDLAGRFAFMTGDVLNPDLRRFATEHGVHLLAKPFDIATVGETVRTLLDGRAP
jgi:CheY-like chemotaxis protein